MDPKHDLNTELEREIGDGIKSAPDLDPPEWLAGAVMKRIAPKRDGRFGLITRLAGKVALSPPALAFAMGCIILAFAAGFFSGGRWERAAGVRNIAALIPVMEDDAEASFLLGRGLMAAGMEEEAARYLSRAVDLEPLQVEYRLWLGRALGAAERVEEEVRQYRLAAAIDRGSPESMHGLADAFLRAGMYEQAAEEYGRILTAWPEDPEAHYGLAGALLRLGRQERAAAHLKRFLALNARDGRAVEAAAMLNQLGDYDYRPTVIGRRRIALKTPEFSEGALTGESRRTLAELSGILAHSPNTVLHVVAYSKNDISLARRRALAVKREILNSPAGISPDRIRTSWFDSVDTGEGGQKLSNSIRIFGVLQKTSEKQGVRT